MGLEMINEFTVAFIDTAIMMGVAIVIAIIIGVPLGIGLFVTSEGLFWENKLIQNVAGTIVNIIRSIPYIILLVVLFPLSMLILGTTTGPLAASVSLTVAAIPFYARLVETSLREIDKGVIEAAEACGASPFLIIKDVLLPEARSGMIAGLTVTIISLLGYSAMAGTVGGGGIGDLAIRFGYQRFQNDVLIVTLIILIILVQLIQFIGDKLARATNRS